MTTAVSAEPLSRRAPEARRQRVLDAARRLFLTHGYERTRVEVVAADAGVSVGAVYKYHPTKAHLLAAVREEYEQRFLAAVDDPALRALRPRDRFRPLLAALFEAAARNPDLVAMLALPDQLVGHEPAPAPPRMHARVAAMIADGVRSGDFRPVDPAQAAVVAYGMVEAAMRQSFGADGGASAPAFVALLAEAWTRWLVIVPEPV